MDCLLDHEALAYSSMYEVTCTHLVQKIYVSIKHTRIKYEHSVNLSVKKMCHQVLVNDYFRNSGNPICVIKNNM